MPHRARVALGDDPNLTLGDLARTPAERFTPEDVIFINSYLKTHGLRLGALLEDTKPGPVANAPEKPGPFAALSERLQTKLRELNVHSAADFSARFTFSRLLQENPMPPYWDEMIAYCLREGHPVRSGAEKSRLTCREETDALWLRVRKRLNELGVTNARSLAKKYSLTALRDLGVPLRMMQSIMDWAETCGTPIRVTESERLSCQGEFAPAAASASI